MKYKSIVLEIRKELDGCQQIRGIASTKEEHLIRLNVMDRMVDKLEKKLRYIK